jgi:ubiquinone/menaquinone biosynthesis C-methylase UbiE
MITNKEKNIDLEYCDTCPLCHSHQIHDFDTSINLRKCHDCSFIFLNPRPAYKAIFHFYSRNQKYDGWIKNIDGREEMWKCRLSKILPLKKDGKLLDVGTGIGQFLAISKKYYPDSCGTEISESAVQLANEKYHITVFKGTLDSLHFKENSFDIITMFHVLEHLHEPDLTMKEIGTLLKPGGILIIAIPNEIDSLRRIIKKIFGYMGIKFHKSQGKSGINKIDLTSINGEIHLSYFTSKVLKRYLVNHGFIIVDDSLDPYFASKGFKRIIDNIYYNVNIIFYRLTCINLYDTIWIAAKKQ